MMKSFWKRTLAVFLSLTMILGYLPFQARANEPIDDGFDAWPEQQRVYVPALGIEATMKVNTTSNSGQLTYQWYEDTADPEDPNVWEAMVGETEDTLTVIFEGFKEYYCHVEDTYSGEERDLHFCVTGLKAWATSNAYVLVEYGDSVTFSISASSFFSGNFIYEWSLAGEVIETATGYSMTLDNCTTAGPVCCTVSDGQDSCSVYFSLEVVPANTPNLSLGTTDITLNWYRFIPEYTTTYYFSWTGNENESITMINSVGGWMGGWAGSSTETAEMYLEAGETYYFTFNGNIEDATFTVDYDDDSYFEVNCEINDYCQIEPGDEVQLQAAISASTHVTYQWYRYGEPIEGATESSLIVSRGGKYSCYAEDENGNSVTIYREVEVIGYSFGTHWGNFDNWVDYGNNVTIIIVPDETNEAEILSYRWYYWGSNGEKVYIENADSDTITVGPITTQTDYWVEMEDSWGNLQTNGVAIFVNNNFSLYGYDENGSYTENVVKKISLGGIVTLVAEGRCTTGEISYQWYQMNDEGVFEPIEGETSYIFYTPSIMHIEQFRCEAEDIYRNRGSVDYLVLIDSGFSAERVGDYVQFVSSGEDVTFEVNASSYYEDSLSYKWYQTDESGQNEVLIGEESSITFEDLTDDIDFGTVYCHVEDTYNSSDLFFAAFITDGVVPVLLNESTPGISINRAGGYAWASYTAQTTASHNLHVESSNEFRVIIHDHNWDTIGSYQGSDGDVVLDLSSGETYYFMYSFEGESSQATGTIETLLELNEDLYLYAEAADQESYQINPGETALLQVDVDTNMFGITYTWKYNDVVIEGADTDTYPATKTGSYQCIVSSADESCTVSFWVRVDNEIRFDVDGAIIPYGSSTTLTVDLETPSMDEVTIQWLEGRYFIGEHGEDSIELIEIAGATGLSYTTPELTQAKIYYVSVSDNYGNSESRGASVGISNGFGTPSGSDVNVTPGETAELDATSTATEGELTYQWFRWSNERGCFILVPDETAATMLVEDWTNGEEVLCLVYDMYGNRGAVWFSIRMDSGLSVNRVGNYGRFVEPGEDVSVSVQISTDYPENLSITWYQRHSDYGAWEVIEGEEESTILFENLTEEIGHLRCHVEDGYNTGDVDFLVVFTPQFTPLVLGEDVAVTISEAGDYAWCSYVPEITDTYSLWYSSPYYNRVIVFDSEFNLIRDSWSYNSTIPDLELTAGQTYYIAYQFCDLESTGSIQTRLALNQNLYLEAWAIGQQNYQINAGESAALQVGVNTNINDITYTWKYKDEVIEDADTDSYSATKAGYYECIVSGGEYSSTVSFWVSVDSNIYFYITGGDGMLPYGEPASFTVIMNEPSAEEVTFQWYEAMFYTDQYGRNLFDLEEIPGATEATYTIEELTQYHYLCVCVTDQYGNSNSRYVNACIENGFGVSSGEDIYVRPGENATLTVTAYADNGGFTYQWCQRTLIEIPEEGYSYWGYLDIEGATEPTFVVENVTEDMVIFCRVKDMYGTPTGAEFHIYLDTGFSAERIGDWMRFINPGDDVTLAVQATSDYPENLEYTWYQYKICPYYENEWDPEPSYRWDWAPVGNESSITFTNVTAEINDLYCRVTDGVNTKDISFEVYFLPDDPASFPLNQYETVTIETEGTGVWYTFVPSVTGQYELTLNCGTGATATVVGAARLGLDNNSDSYYCICPSGDPKTMSLVGGHTYYIMFRFIDSASTTGSMTAYLHLPSGLIAYTNQSNYSLQPGETAALTVITESTSNNLTYTWERYGEVLEETSNILVTGKAGYYYCTVSDDLGHSQAVDFFVSVNSWIYQSHFTGETVIPYGGSTSVTIIIDRADSDEFTYQWEIYDPDTERYYTIEGATSDTISAQDVTRSIDYMVDVTDEYGTTIGYPVQIEIENGFSVSTDQRNYYIPTGGSVTLSVTASANQGDFTYLWYRCYDKAMVDDFGNTYYQYVEEKVEGATQSQCTISDVAGHTEVRCEVVDFYGSRHRIWFTITPVSIDDPQAITIDTPNSMAVNTDIWYSFVPSESANYEITSPSNSTVNCLILDENWNQIYNGSIQGSISCYLEAGNTYYIRCLGIGTFTVQESAFQIQSMTVETQYAFENEHGYWSLGADGSEYFRYSFSTKVTVTLKSGQTYTGQPWTVVNQIKTDFGLSTLGWAILDDQDIEPWTAGDHLYEVQLGGFTATAHYVIWASPIASIEVENATIFEHTEGRWTQAGGISYYEYDAIPDRITATLTEEYGGEVITGSPFYIIDQVCELMNIDSNDVYLQIRHSQGANNPWGLGDHVQTWSMLGYEFSRVLTIVEDPVVSVSAEDVVVYDGINWGILFYLEAEPIRGYRQVGRYLKVTVELDDETTLSGYYYDVQDAFYEKYGIEMNYDDQWEWMQVEEPWTVGNSYETAVDILGHSAPFTVHVLPVNVESITADTLYLNENDTTTTLWWDATIQDYVPWDGYYDFYNDVIYTVTTTDGQTYRGNAAKMAEYFNDFEPYGWTDQSPDNPLTPGSHEGYISFLGISGTFEIVLLPEGGFTITSQPQDTAVVKGQKATFSVQTSVAGSTYQWQYSTNGGTSWLNSPSSGNNTTTVTVNTSLSMNGRLYRCVVTCGDEELVSSAALLTVQGIKTQPTDETVFQSGVVHFSVGTTAEADAYQWQYSTNGGTSWVNSVGTGCKTDTVTVNATVNANGRLYRCLVTYGDTVLTSGTATLTVYGIKTQPEDKIVVAGTKAVFSVVATEGATYQWQYSTNDGETWLNTTSSGNKTDTVTVNTAASMSGRLYRCVVTYDDVEMTTREASLIVLGISSQPTSQTVTAGSKVTFKVETTADADAYQWQYSTNGGTTWTNSPSSGNKSDTVNVNATVAMNGRLYRCQVTFGDTVLTSKAAELTVIGITSQPTDQTAATGKKAIFTVETTVDGATYQWQYSTNDGTTWINSTSSGNKTARLSVNANVGMNGRLYRCLITYEDTELKTNSALLTVQGITTQPTDETVVAGNQVEFSVETTVEGATYQWQYSTNDGTTWTNSPSTGNKTETVSINSSAAMNGRLYRCQVTYGDTVLTTRSALLTVEGIKTQPSAQTVVAGNKVTFSVETTVEGASFQWQYSTNNGTTWINSPSTGNKTATVTVNSSVAMNGRLYRCQVSYDDVTLTSKTALLTVQGIKTQPAAQTEVAGEKAVFTVETTVDGATYQWQYSVNGSTWINSPSSGNKTDTVTVNTSAAMNGRKYRCLVTCGDTTITSKAALLTVEGIKTQPKATTVSAGEKATFKVETTVDGATYQWQYSTNGGTTWVNSPSSGNKTDTITVNTNAGMNGRLYRCKVTYEDVTLTSSTAKLTVE